MQTSLSIQITTGTLMPSTGILQEQRDLPGGWRFRQWFERQDFGLERQKDPILCATRHSVSIVIDPRNDHGVESSIFQTGTYEPGTLHVLDRVLNRGARFVDVGANVGLMSLVAARKVGSEGRVDCFEPLPEIRALLEASIRANGFNAITVHPHAVGSSASSATISRHPEVNRGSASLAWAGDKALQTEVRIERLDVALPDWHVRPPSMVKIDVEGWEFEVIKGATGILSAPKPPALCVEFSRNHPMQGGTVDELFRHICSFGYSGYCLIGSKSRPSPLELISPERIPEHDNVFFFHPRGGLPDAFGLQV